MNPNALVDALTTMDGDAAVSIINEVLKAKAGISTAVVAAACPALTYAPAKSMERRCQGVLMSMNQETGKGTIASPELELVFGQDCVVDAKQAWPFETGAEVSFGVVINKELQPQAFDLRPANMLPLSSEVEAQALQASQAVHAAGPSGVVQPGSHFSDGATAASGAVGSLKRPRVVPPVDPSGPCIGQFMGIIKSFSDKNGFGFIESDVNCDGVNQDVWFHKSQLADMQVGQLVTFEAYQGNFGQLRARALMPVPTSVSR